MGQRGLVSYEPAVRAGDAVKEVGRPADAVSSSRYLVGRGVKRKLSSTEEALCLPYPQQRQLVLDLCLDKLQSVHTHAEPSLHRSVLLANTLRQIQEEMQRESGAIPGPVSPCALHAEGPASEDARSVDFGPFELTSSTSYLSDLPLDDIFEDIDTSMYDSSDFSVLAVPSTRGVPCQSAVLDDSLKVFSSCTSASALQLCFSDLSDLDLSDLDHIMEILVRS